MAYKQSNSNRVTSSERFIFKYIHPEIAESSAYVPNLPYQVTVCQPDVPLSFRARPHTHPRAPVNHLPASPPSPTQMDLFQPVLR